MMPNLENLNLGNKEIYIKAFKDLINKIKNNQEIQEEKDFIIKDEEIKGERILTIVPNELLNQYTNFRNEYPEEFLGFSVVVKGLRLSCFGVPCEELSKCVVGGIKN